MERLKGETELCNIELTVAEQCLEEKQRVPLYAGRFALFFGK